MQNAIAQKNFRNIQQVAHCMKSSVSYLGLTNELEPLLQEIEDQASDGADLFIIHSCFDAVQFTCRQAVDEASQILQQY